MNLKEVILMCILDVHHDHNGLCCVWGKLFPDFLLLCTATYLGVFLSIVRAGNTERENQEDVHGGVHTFKAAWGAST